MAKKLWGGRFEKGTDPLVEQFSRSIQFDYKLARYDVIGSLLHINVLKKAGYLNRAEFGRLSKALREMYATVEKTAAVDTGSEDVHTHLQNLLEKKAGEAALKLHTARSRNDQVVLAMKLFCIDKLQALLGDIAVMQGAFDTAVRRHGALILPGFTHLQHAQPVSAADYFKAYTQMLNRDAARINAILGSTELTFGAGALAGTPVPAEYYSVKLSDAVRIKGVSLPGRSIRAAANSLDAVSDRDFVIEIVSVLSILAMHLSRLAEDLIIWATKEFDFIELDDAYCTGSSLMPQKKNPDVLELTRGYAGRLYGNLVSVLTMMKGLPLTYNRDMQLDKEPLFNSFEIVSMELNVLAGLVKTLKFNRDKIAQHLQDESLYATDMVYYLVGKKVPFRQAHAIVGRLVKYSLDNEIPIKDIPQEKLKEFSGVFVKHEIVKLFDPVVSVKSKRSIRKHA